MTDEAYIDVKMYRPTGVVPWDNLRIEDETGHTERLVSEDSDLYTNLGYAFQPLFFNEEAAREFSKTSSLECAIEEITLTMLASNVPESQREA